MAISNVQFVYNVPRGQEVKLITGIIALRPDVFDHNLSGNSESDRYHHFSMIKLAVSEFFTKEYIEANLGSTRTTLLLLAPHNGNRFPGLILHDCSPNIGYMMAPDAFKGPLIGRVGWTDECMTFETMFPVSIFANARVVNFMEYLDKNPKFAQLVAVSDMQHDQDSRPLNQPYSGILCYHEFVPFENDRGFRNYSFFGSFSSSELLVLHELEDWHAYLADGIFREIYSKSGPFVLAVEVFKNVRRK